VFGARSCAECHETTSFRVAAFDHAKVASASCRSCHDRQNPHADQFGETDCRSCHDTNSYRIEQFDHTRTRFALDGAHTRAACSACHSATTLAGRTLVRYRPLPTTCVACHGGAR
jgi:hypothetical protein